MGVRSLLSWFAAGAPARVFAVPGEGARDAVQDLRLRDELQLVSSPRSATVLLIAGKIPAWATEAALAVHDSISHPRSTVWWTLGEPAGDLNGLFPGAAVTEDDPVEEVVRAQRELLAGARPSEPPLRPDIDPAPWRGVGPYGHGGSGMTGGVPYGRPLADRAADRDGLTLDQIDLKVGPFLSPLPPGLLLQLKLQGDIIQEVHVAEPRGQDVRADIEHSGADPFIRSLHRPVPISELELARARSHLRWLSGALGTQGLGALAHRSLALAHRLGPQDADAAQELSAAVRRTGVLTWSASAVAPIQPDLVAGQGLGPVGRASGIPEDTRVEDPAYVAAGFEPVSEKGADVAARWRQRLAEITQSIELAKRTGDGAVTSLRHRVESPHGRLEADSHPSARLLGLLPALIEGLEWADFVATIASLDLHLDGMSAPAQRDLERAAR